jgi:hypothetical protein
MLRLFLASVVGGLVAFAWSSVFHMVIGGEWGMSTIQAEQPVLDAIDAQAPQAGLYFYPGIDLTRTPTAEEQAAWEARFERGPAGLLLVRPRGEPHMTAQTLIDEFLFDVVCAAILALILGAVSARAFGGLCIGAGLGVFAWLSVSASYMNWWKFPREYFLGEGLDQVVGWALAGMATALVVGKRTA